MRMPSHLRGCTRRTPTQSRGEKRVNRLLDAAIVEFASSGWEATTMSAIAARARSPIGSLYQFFPDKASVARALRTKHIGDLQAMWAALEPLARRGSLAHFVERYVALALDFVDGHPAFLPLLDAPSNTLPVGPRNLLRLDLERLLKTLAPRLGAAAAAQRAEVLLNLNKALMGSYASARRGDRDWIADEFRAVVLSYLRARVLPRGTRKRSA